MNEAVVVFSFPEPGDDNPLAFPVIVQKAKEVFTGMEEVKIHAAVNEAAKEILDILIPKKLRAVRDNKPFEFVTSRDEPLTLESAVFQALGAASTCWDHPEGAGVFHSDEARNIGEKLLKFIKELP